MSGNCYYCGCHPDEIADSRRRRDELEAEIEFVRKDRDSWKVLADLANKRADEARSQLGYAREALEFIRDGYERGDISHVDFRVGAYKEALGALAKIDEQRREEG